MARKRYLKKTPLKEARELFLAKVEPSRIGNELIAVEEALDRVTAAPVFAKISSPHYHAAAMDGICVRAEDTFGATEFNPKKLLQREQRLARSGRVRLRRHRQLAASMGECGNHDRESPPAQRWIVRDF